MFFLDIKLNRFASIRNDTGVKNEVNWGVIASAILFEVHPILHKNKIAISLPDIKTNVEKPRIGRLIRFFSNNRESLGLIVEKLSSQDFIVVDEIKEVIAEQIKGYAIYKRFTVGGRKKKPSPSWSQEIVQQRKSLTLKKRIQDLEKAKRLPFFNVKSLSNYNYFRVHVDLESTKEVKQTDWESLDSYGLSKSKGELWLPLLPY